MALLTASSIIRSAYGREMLFNSSVLLCIRFLSAMVSASCRACIASAVCNSSSRLSEVLFFCKKRSVVFNSCSPSVRASASALAAMSVCAWVMAVSYTHLDVYKRQSASWLIAQQNYYPGWRAFVDKEEKRIEKKNITEMAVQLAPGTHQVIFSYEPAYLRWAVPLSFASLTGILLILSLIHI